MGTRPFRDHTLTPQQRAVLELAERGLPRARIAHALGITVGVVQKHLRAARYHQEASAFYARLAEERTP